jgi:hypothetical protein
VGIELSSPLETRKLFIPRSDKSYKKATNAELRYTPGTQEQIAAFCLGASQFSSRVKANQQDLSIPGTNGGSDDPRTTGWSEEEESIIATIQQTESVPRPEAIRRMQRRKKLSPSDAALTTKRPTGLATGRLCRNPRCTRGDDRGPGSLAPLRADALYCNTTCKKAALRSLKHKNRTSNRQCLCGSRGDKFSSLLSPP